MHPGSKCVVGIGGNIGTGKTTVVQIFKEFGAHCISADEIGWEVLPKIARVLRERFGEGIMSGSRINKKKLRELVFSDSSNLEFLNRVSHPLLIKRIIDAISNIERGVVVIDAALLFDWPEVYSMVDYPILVKARQDVMLARVKAKGISEDLFMRILSMQKDAEKMAAEAHFVIENNGTVAELRERCLDIYQQIENDC
jgi:dephospho-CoA kinase